MIPIDPWIKEQIPDKPADEVDEGIGSKILIDETDLRSLMGLLVDKS